MATGSLESDGKASRSEGYDNVDVAGDKATRLAYAEMLADEQKPMVIGFLAVLSSGSTARGSSAGG